MNRSPSYGKAIRDNRASLALSQRLIKLVAERQIGHSMGVLIIRLSATQYLFRRRDYNHNFDIGPLDKHQAAKMIDQYGMKQHQELT